MAWACNAALANEGEKNAHTDAFQEGVCACVCVCVCAGVGFMGLQSCAA